jgi:hypothetical protein
VPQPGHDATVGVLVALVAQDLNPAQDGLLDLVAYAEPLARREVSSPDSVDQSCGRADTRSKARADKIRVMTIRSADRAIAVRRLSVPKDQEPAVLSAAMQRGEVLRGDAERARQLGHEIVRWVAQDQESIAMCPPLPRPAIRPADAVPPVLEGAALDRVCPGLTRDAQSSPETRRAACGGR